MKETVSAYYQLTKPRVTYGNVLTAVAGFFLAAHGSIDWTLFLAMLSGMTLVVGGACALNNYYDRDIDAVMERTKNRPSVTGALSPMSMRIFALITTLIGATILGLWTNVLTLTIATLGFITYVWLYGRWTKRTSTHGTAVGAISGAFPIAGGYAAVTGSVDGALILLFLIMFFWQFPEFYSIAIYRRKEYAAANVPVMPVVEGIRSTILQIFIYTVLYYISTLVLISFAKLGLVYFIVMAGFGGYWVWLASRGFTTRTASAWARQMFRFSMITIVVLCLMLSVGPRLP